MQALLYSVYNDETAILTTILQQAGMAVTPVKELSLILEDWPQRPGDLILIALARDTLQFKTFVRQVRVDAAVPIVLVTSGLSEEEQVEWMETGVDLVVLRPYGVRLLLAQLRVLLRRSLLLPFHTLPKMTRNGIVLDPTSHTVKVGEGEPKRLTQLEFRLLYAFMTHPGQIIPPENLVEYVWGYNGEGNRELVRGLVQRLRSKVEPDPGTPKYILTEQGVGYLFD